MTKKQLGRVVDDLVRQGARVRRMRSGYFVYLPDGSSASVHLSTSDWRGIKNFRAIVERAGMTWPVQ
jgi:hypothetical protein